MPIGIVTAVEMHVPAGPIQDPEHSIDIGVYAHEGRFIHANEIDGDCLYQEILSLHTHVNSYEEITGDVTKHLVRLHAC